MKNKDNVLATHKPHRGNNCYFISFFNAMKTSCGFADPAFRSQFEFKKKLMDMRTQQHFVEVCCNFTSVSQTLGSFDNKGIKQKWNLIAGGTPRW